MADAGYLYLTLTLFLICLTLRTANCQTTLETFAENIYSFVSGPALSWKDARKACTDKASYLLIIENAQERDFIVHKLNGTKVGWWLGGEDMTTSFTFQWWNGTVIPINISDWYPGVYNPTLFDYQYKQPSDPFDTTDQNCLEYRQFNIDTQNVMLKRPYWNDADCANLNSYICKAPKPQQPQNCGFSQTSASECVANMRTKAGICRHTGKLLNSMVATKKTRTLLQCALECFQLTKPMCLSANYNPTTNICELSTGSKTDSPTDYVHDPLFRYIATDAC